MAGALRRERAGPAGRKLAALLAGSLLSLLCFGGSCAHAFLADEPRPEEVLRRAEERFQTLQDYECLADTDATLGKKRDAGTYRIWFKKPHMLRVRVIRGKHRGSEVAQDARGAVRGHEGGLLKPIVIRLSPTDKRLRGLRGLPVTEIDWGSFYAKCRERAGRPGARLALAPRPSSEAPYELVVTYLDQGTAVREVYRIDPQRWVMSEGEVFEDGMRVDHIVFRDIRLDTGVAEKWFKL